eukprot:symbB.v1.2.035238.t1/scaffold4698.1/size36197/1
MAPNGAEEDALRQVLLRLLFLQRSEAQGNTTMQEMPPFAMLRRKGQDIDLSEMYSVAELLEMSHAELRAQAEEVKKSSRLALPLKPSLAALKRLKVLLQEWHVELLHVAPERSGREKNTFLRRYRQTVAEMVAAALKQVEAEELASSLDSPLAMAMATLPFVLARPSVVVVPLQNIGQHSGATSKAIGSSTICTTMAGLAWVSRARIR